MNVYFAGKISKGDWRHTIFPSLRGAADLGWAEETGGHGLPQQVNYEPQAHGFTYCGPFFISCDHGGFHGHGTHGMAVGKPDVLCCAWYDKHTTRESEVVSYCKRWIDSCDAVFVWLGAGDVDAFGTFAEVGYAAALNKPIWLYEPEPGRADWWFVRELATEHHFASNPLAAFCDFAAQMGHQVTDAVRRASPVDAGDEDEFEFAQTDVWHALEELRPTAPCAFSSVGLVGLSDCDIHLLTPNRAWLNYRGLTLLEARDGPVNSYFGLRSRGLISTIVDAANEAGLPRDFVFVRKIWWDNAHSSSLTVYLDVILGDSGTADGAAFTFLTWAGQTEGVAGWDGDFVTYLVRILRENHARDRFCQLDEYRYRPFFSQDPDADDAWVPIELEHGMVIAPVFPVPREIRVVQQVDESVQEISDGSPNNSDEWR